VRWRGIAWKWLKVKKKGAYILKTSRNLFFCFPVFLFWFLVLSSKPGKS